MKIELRLRILNLRSGLESSFLIIIYDCLLHWHSFGLEGWVTYENHTGHKVLTGNQNTYISNLQVQCIISLIQIFLA